MKRVQIAAIALCMVGSGSTRVAWAHGACANEERQGEYAYYRGEYQRSIGFFQQAAQRPCGRTAFWPTYMIGENYCALGDWNQCADYSRKAIELDPTNGRAYGNLGHALLQLGRVDEAIQWLEQGISRDAAHEMLHNNLGAAYMLKEQYEIAVKHFQDALYWNEDEPLIYRNLAAALSAQGDWERAAQYAEQALALDEHNQDAQAIVRFARQKRHMTEQPMSPEPSTLKPASPPPVFRPLFLTSTALPPP